MRDNELIAFVADTIDAALVAAGTQALVVQKFQPTQQGTPTAPTVFVDKLFDIKYGWQRSELVFNQDKKSYDENNKQLVNSTIQISALYRQDPNDLSLPTPSDLINDVSMFIMSHSNLAKWRASKVGVLRINVVGNEKFEDDRHQFESFPSIDLVITHERSLTLEVPAAFTIEESFTIPI